MASAEVTTRSGRKIKAPIQKYEQNCVMNADKVAKYRKKVNNRLPTLKRVHTYREKKKKTVKKNSKKTKK